MDKFFSYCPQCQFEFHETEEEAKRYADEHLEHFREEAPDGWSDEVWAVCWGEIKASAQETERRPYNPDTDFGIDSDCECVVDYGILPIESLP